MASSSALGLEVTGWISIFWPLSQSLPAVEGVTLLGIPPLYTAIFACRENEKTNAQSATSSA